MKDKTKQQTHTVDIQGKEQHVLWIIDFGLKAGQTDVQKFFSLFRLIFRDSESPHGWQQLIFLI